MVYEDDGDMYEGTDQAVNTPTSKPAGTVANKSAAVEEANSDVGARKDSEPAADTATADDWESLAVDVDKPDKISSATLTPVTTAIPDTGQEVAQPFGYTAGGDDDDIDVDDDDSSDTSMFSPEHRDTVRNIESRPSEVNLKLLTSVVEHIMTQDPDKGAILIFVAGTSEITRCIRAIEGGVVQMIVCVRVCVPEVFALMEIAAVQNRSMFHKAKSGTPCPVV